jgi:nucleoside-diphosphate-sugar epimerase
VQRLIHISNVYVYGRPQTPTVAETHPLAPHTRKGRYRKQQEDLVVAAHDPSGLRTLILRPADFYGPTATNSAPAFALKAALAGKTANLLGPATKPHEYVYVPDLAPIIADLLQRPEAFGSAYNVAGSGQISTREFVEQLLRAAGKPLKIREAGVALLRVMGFFDPIMRELVEMHYLQSTPVLLDETKLRGVLPHLHKSPYAEAIAATAAAAVAKHDHPE